MLIYIYITLYYLLEIPGLNPTAVSGRPWLQGYSWQPPPPSCRFSHRPPPGRRPAAWSMVISMVNDG